MTVQAGGAVLVLVAAVLWLWRYGVQRRQQRTLVWALAAAIGEMESAIRWQQTPMMALLEGLAARETVGQYFHETADMVQGGMPLQCAWEQVFEKMPDGEAGEILARLRLGGDRAVPAAMPGGRTEEPGDDGCGAVRRGTGHHFTDMRGEPWMWI